MPGLSKPPSQALGGVSEQASAVRTAGGLLVLTALVTAVSAVTRVSSDADFQPSLQDTLDAISLHPGLYGAGGGARLASGITLGAAAWFLLMTPIIRLRLGSTLVPALFGVSGVFTAVSGLCAVILAVAAPETNPLIELAALFRWISGKIGFSLAGLALVIAFRFRPKAGGLLRFIAPASGILGLAMHFIWIDSATPVHAIVGAAFFLWLPAAGSMLFRGRAELLFPRMVESDSQP
ncbi:MAG: hypothetical protein OXH26_11495 [bacterium]|nr:hypothetical protein [bacterium]